MLRVSRTLAERGAATVYEQDVDVTDINAAVDSSVVAVVQALANIGAGVRLPDDGIATAIRSVRANTRQRGRELGVRLGPVMYRNDSNLVFGSSAGTYVEAYLAVMPEFLSLGQPGGKYDVGFEFLYGGDMGEDYSFRTASIHSFSVNLKMYMTPWRYSRAAINFALGAGAGFTALRYSFQPGDRRFIGDENFHDAAARLAVNFFAIASIPLFKAIEGDAVVRWAPPLGDLRRFANVQDEGIVWDTPLVGPLGGVYFAFGLKYRF